MAGLEPQQLCSALEKNRRGEMEKKGVDALLGGSGREGAATGIKQRSCMLCLDWWHWRLDRRREVEERTSLPGPTRTASCTTPLSPRLPTPVLELPRTHSSTTPSVHSRSTRRRGAMPWWGSAQPDPRGGPRGSGFGGRHPWQEGGVGFERMEEGDDRWAACGRVEGKRSSRVVWTIRKYGRLQTCSNESKTEKIEWSGFRAKL
ncbi:hypothetical protein PAHAL_6G076700 [Panicum hallii]|jgi:hypothetical protein|uniref:Uncharacterized protein n=1 Tax=Panicum hallii TaxID=206008 RepID=A0A2S3I164_9POAL|nr:hypothetical protein PAHAL_6G076700 [Panicum hallii]